VLGRFVAALRVFVTAAAAASGLPYYQYLLGEIVGALLWSSIFVLFGYGIGQSLSAAIGTAGAGTITLVLLVGSIAMVGATAAYRSWRGTSRSVGASRRPDRPGRLEAPRA
jgi:membrane protein DedA with SNARE-associated domain